MREIKFRAWNVAIKKMIDLKKITPLALNMNTDGLFIPFSDGLPLMQFTGLKDKNGKDVYEGDILKTINHTALVVWNGSGWKLQHINGKKRDWCLPKKSSGIYIIGNIYESPELLKPNA